MSDREKLLGIVIGALLVLFAGFGTYRTVSNGLRTKHARIETLKTDLGKAKQENKDAKHAQQQVSWYQQRALPGDTAMAHREFVNWLEDQVQAVGLEKDAIKSDPLPKSKDVHKQLSYSVTGVGDIRQITQLFYKIHAAETLHRIRSFDLIRDQNKLKLTMWVDALTMPDNPQLPKVPIGEVTETKVARSLAEYEQKITQRNLFSPGNQAPQLRSLGTENVALGDALNYQIRATDPDDDELTFELGEEAPASARLSRSGRLTWNPEELGEYEFKIYVTDEGIPSKEDVGTLLVKVIPKKEEEPAVEDEFDESKVAMFTGIVQGPQDANPRMWMYLRDKDESQILQPGDRIRIGKWRGEVLVVDPDRNVARIQTDEGEFILKLGEALADAKLVEEKETL